MSTIGFSSILKKTIYNFSDKNVDIKPLSIPSTGFNSGMLNLSNGEATVPEDGIYILQSQVNFLWNHNKSDRGIILNLFLNDKKWVADNSSYDATDNDSITYDINTTLILKAGDKLKLVLYIETLDGFKQFIMGGSNPINTYWSMVKL